MALTSESLQSFGKGLATQSLSQGQVLGGAPLTPRLWAMAIPAQVAMKKIGRDVKLDTQNISKPTSF